MDFTIDGIYALLRQFNPRFTDVNKHKQRAELNDFRTFCCDASDFDSDILYLVRREDLPLFAQVKTPLNVLCFTDEKSTADLAQHSIVLLPPDADKTRVESLLREFFGKQKTINAAKIKLFDTFCSQEGLKSLMKTGFELLENPFFIVDISYHIIAYTHCDIDTKRMEQWERIRTDQISYQAVSLLREDGSLQKTYESDEPQLNYAGYDKIRSIGMRLTIKNHPVGHIVLYEYFRPFASTDSEIMKILAHTVSCELQKSSGDPKDREASDDIVLTDCLNAAIKREDLPVRMMNCKFRQKKNTWVMAVVPTDSSSKSISLSYLKRVLSDLLPDAISAAYHQTIVVLLSGDTEKYLPDYKQNQLQTFFADNGLTAGISNRFDDILEIPRYYLQACDAAKLGKKLTGSYALYSYEKFLHFSLIEQAEKAGTLDDFCSPKLAELFAYDGENHTEYADTLYRYLTNGGDLKKTAEELHIHRNTADYRIHRIEELLAVNLNDTETCFLFYLTFHILIYRNQYQPNENEK